MLRVLGYQKLNVFVLQSDRKYTLWCWYLVDSVDPTLVSTDICSHGGRPWKKEQKNIHLKASPKGILPRYHYKLII